MNPIRVAVIGSGAGGLCALRHLSATHGRIYAVGFEQTSVVGGTWVYTDRVGTDDNGLPVHSSMYKNMRTNLPKEVMGFQDYPFKKDLPSFMRHQDVRQYLEEYCDHFDVRKYIKFLSCVEKVHPVTSGEQVSWSVSYRSVTDPDKQHSTETFDAVIVCSGHYSVPLMPTLPGLKDFHGQCLHSHNYRDPKAFTNQRVVCLGAASSGQDISLELATVAQKVYLSHSTPQLMSILPDNLHQKPGIKEVTANTVIFTDGSEEVVDAIVFCTGYHFSFPFLSNDCRIDITDERVTPLYKHTIHTIYPTLSFIGLCKQICPFPQFHLQVLLAVSVLDGSLNLPSREEMDGDTQQDFDQRSRAGEPPRHAHKMGAVRQWRYNDELSDMLSVERIPENIEALYTSVHETRVKDLPNYKKVQYELIGSKSHRRLDSS